ncbi:MAG: amidohydrolase [Saprospiraceae bacterium]|nr:MAG: amidohydrolase [Saprospiraceae bacterium]
MKINLKYSLIFCLLLLAGGFLWAQSPIPAANQAEPIAIVGATAHLGNGQVIQNSLIGFEGGKLTVVEAYNQQALDKYRVIQAEGKHVYPGLIAPNTQLGLIEIGAVRATRDNDETGSLNPNVRSIIAYNTDSQVIPTIRSMGVLLAQIAPEGGLISGQSSIVQLDAWNWEDAAYKADEGLYLRLPAKQSYSWRRGTYQKNEAYDDQMLEIATYFADAKGYCQQTTAKAENLKLEAACGLFNGSKKLYVQANSVEAITQAVLLAKQHAISLVIVGGEDAWRIPGLLKENNVAVILRSTQSLPGLPDDDVDLPFKTPKLLQEAGILYCIGHEGFWQYRNLAFQAGQAVGYGLDYEAAISALTLNTAKILGIDDRAGSLEVGKDAILFISQGDVLDMRSAEVIHAFIQGREIDLNNKQKVLYHKFQEKFRRER